MKSSIAALSALLLLAGSQATFAQDRVDAVDESANTLTIDYGAPISSAVAGKILAGAEQEAERMRINVAITIVDSAGNLVRFSKDDNTHLASIPVSQDKARTALGFRRSTRLLQEAVLSGKAANLTTIPGMVAIEGGLLIVGGGRIIGAIGVSGGTSAEDAIVARAGIAAARQ